jgi:phage terminase large subunit-like protein
MLIEDAMTGSALADEVECEFPSCVQRIKPEGDKQVRLYVQSAKCRDASGFPRKR